MKPRREAPIPDAEWRALAAQNPGRVTYPSWKPKGHWDAKNKADPWKPSENLDWRKANRRKATFLSVVVGWMWPAVPALPPSGMNLRSVRPEYRGANDGTRRKNR